MFLSEIHVFCVIAAVAEILETDHHRHISIVSVVDMWIMPTSMQQKTFWRQGMPCQPVMRFGLERPHFCRNPSVELGRNTVFQQESPPVRRGEDVNRYGLHRNALCFRAYGVCAFRKSPFTPLPRTRRPLLFFCVFCFCLTVFGRNHVFTPKTRLHLCGAAKPRSVVF